jgi:peptide/nickel transport system substrate-binding protein
MAHRWFGSPKSIIFAPLLLALLFIIACGGSATAPPPPTSKPAAAPAATQPSGEAVTSAPVPTAQPAAASPELIGVAPGGKYGGVLQAYQNTQPEDWDPHPCGSGNCMSAISKMYNQLLKRNPLKPDEMIGDLAQSWEATEGGNAYIFRIHDGIQWWDGEPLTAEDVAFSIHRMIDPQARRPRSGFIRNYVEKAEVLDPTTVKVSLKFPAAAFFSYMGSDYMSIVPKHVIEAGVDINKFDNIVGSGPWKITDFRQGSDYEFVKNEDYFKEGLPYFDGIKVFIIPDPGRAIASFLAQQVLICGFPYCNFIPEEFEQLEQQGSDILKVWWEPPSIIGYLNLNVNHKPLDDPRVRRAIHLAIDRDELLEAGGGGRWTIGSVLHPSFSIGEEEIRQLPGFRKPKDEDIAEAQRLLAEAGYPGGQGFPPLTAIARTSVAFYADAGAIIKQQLKDALGIDTITIQVMESAAGMVAYREDQWDMSPLLNGLINTDPEDILMQAYTPNAAWNFSRWTDPKFDELFAKQTSEQDPAKRLEILRELERYLLTDANDHVVELWWQNHAWVVSNQIGGMVAAPPLTNCCMKLEHLWLER